MHLTTYLQKDRLDRDGLARLYLILRQDNKSHWINTGIKVNPKNWDGHRIKRGAGNSLRLNDKLTTLIRNYEKAILRLEEEGRSVTFETVKAKVKSAQGTVITEYARTLLDHSPHLKRKTKEQQYYLCDKLDAYHPGLMFHEVGERELQLLHGHWHESGLGMKSIEGLMRCLRKFFNAAIQEGLVTNYPFRRTTGGQGFRVGNRRGQRDHLDMEQLDRLEALLDGGSLGLRQATVCRWFLLASYTGLRGQDCRTLSWDDITHDRYLCKRTEKTGEIVHVPITDRARKHLAMAIERRLPKHYHSVNATLREVCALAGIETSRLITFHSARHSFAVNCLLLGIPIEVVQRLLGHNDLATTQVYARIKDAYLNTAMQAWDAQTKKARSESHS